MQRLLFLLSLRPMIFGLTGMTISGICFPLAGVIIVRNSLIPMRYMLMHGVILGGIFSVALGLPLVPTVAALNIVLVFAMLALNRNTGLGPASSAMMVFTMGLASMLGHVFNVPAKDTLEILWGSPFALVAGDLAILGVLAVVIIAYIILCFRPISMLFFDHDIARSSGVNVTFHNTLMLLMTALMISVAMKLLGALLIDALVVLPVLAASGNAASLRQMFLRSSATGLALSLSGYFIALLTNLPVSGVLAILAAALYLTNLVLNKIRKKKKESKQ